MRQEKILLVDDEPNLLSSFKRQFRKEYDIHTAGCADEALATIEREGPFAVVVSDYNMPGMSGVDLFRKLGNLGDRSTRIMLTGSVEQTIAVAAVNDGGVFRFHNKSAEYTDLNRSIADGVAYYKSATVQRGTAGASSPSEAALSAEFAVLCDEVKAAVEKEQFQLVYQPQLDVVSGAVAGLEALLRWSHPTLGSISPDIFVPVLEQTGMIGKVGRRVLEQACEQLNRLHKCGFSSLRMAVNLSPQQLLQNDLVETVESVLRRTGVSPGCVELELTEGTAVDVDRRTLRRLDELKALGVQLAIDDFGAGYSTFAYLTQFPLDRLKIDKSLLGDIERDHQHRTVTQAIVDLGHRLDMSVTVEGVERQAQLDIVRHMGGDEFQGFLISPPVAADSLVPFLSRLGMCAPENR